MNFNLSLDFFKNINVANINWLTQLTNVLLFILPLVIITVCLYISDLVSQEVIRPSLLKVYQNLKANFTTTQKQILLPLIAQIPWGIIIISTQIGSLPQRASKFNNGLSYVIAAFVIIVLMNQFKPKSRLVYWRELLFLVIGMGVFGVSIANGSLELVEVLVMLVYFGGYLLICNFWVEIIDFLERNNLLTKFYTRDFEIKNSDILPAIESCLVSTKVHPLKFIPDFITKNTNIYLTIGFSTLINIALFSVAFLTVDFWSKFSSLPGAFVFAAVGGYLAYKSKDIFKSTETNTHIWSFFWLVGMNLVALPAIILNIGFPVLINNYNRSIFECAALIMVFFGLIQINNQVRKTQINNKFIYILALLFGLINLALLFLKFK